MTRDDREHQVHRWPIVLVVRRNRRRAAIPVGMIVRVVVMRMSVGVI